LAAQATGDSESLTKALNTLANAQNSISLVFMGMGSLFLGVILMAMMATGVGSIRDEEAKNYLDNIVVGPVSRVRWLAGRLAVLVAGSAAIVLIASSVGWLVAHKQGIDVNFSTMVIDSFSLLGPVFLLLSIGILFYGLSARLSRWAAPFMYVVLAWSFVVDLLASVIDLGKIVTNSSLLHYIAFVPAAQPDWKACWILTGVAVVLTAVGILAFNRRDLETE
jgi:ABC-2 type transport system permease protein